MDRRGFLFQALAAWWGAYLEEQNHSPWKARKNFHGEFIKDTLSSDAGIYGQPLNGFVIKVCTHFPDYSIQ